MNHSEWLSARNKGIGGSDAAAILGRNPYMTNTDLYDYKIGAKAPDDISDQPYVKYGNEAETPLIDLFKLDYPQYDVFHKKHDLRVSPEHSFIIGSIDGELIDKTTGEKGVLEIKTTNILQSMQREKWNDRIPDNYFIQVLHYLLVTGYTFAILKAQLKFQYPCKDFPEGYQVKLDTRHYYIKRELYENDIQFLKSKEIAFWENNIMPRVRPSLLLPQI